MPVPASLREPFFEALGSTKVCVRADVYLEGLDVVLDDRDDVFFGVTSSSAFACTVGDRIALVVTGIFILGGRLQE